MKDIGTSVNHKRRNTSISQLENEQSSKISFSSYYPTSLTNFQLSANSCVNIKGAEFEVFVSSSYDALFHKRKDKEVFADYFQPIILSTDEDGNPEKGNKDNTVTSLLNVIKGDSTIEISPTVLHTRTPPTVSEKSQNYVRTVL